MEEVDQDFVFIEDYNTMGGDDAIHLRVVVG